MPEKIAIFSEETEAGLEEKKQIAAALLDKHKILFDDFPHKGIRYLDFYRTFDKNPNVRNAVIECLQGRYEGSKIDAVAGIGAGGFGLGATLAYVLNVPFHPIRKASDTVYDASEASVGMVYAERKLTLANDVVERGSRVVLIDDTVATGGTSLGALSLLKNAGATVVEVATLFETISKNGRKALSPTPLFAILSRDVF
ncbi:phosphoribosyltransferase family protein [Rhizobium nepotum]|uniref:phosphoribosyltransferase family protein n=1 Tax=Rhizobium nepotum TaxID=1035271 RepID=UPI0006981DCF|nr:phosphoribosyltransferase family protein [Rhizobium nepotum]